MSGNASPRATAMGLSPSELDTYAQYAWLSGRVGEAIDLYSDLARLHRRSPHVHFKLGYLYLSLHDNTAAVKHFTLEIERHGDEVFEPDDEKRQQQQQRAFLFCAYAGRSDALLALGETSKAEMDQLFILNRNGRSKPALLAMGRLYFRFGMHQRADSCFEAFAGLDPDDPEYLVEHAELRLAQRRPAIAATMFEKCRHHISSSSPTYHRALIGEGSALIRQDKLQDAMILLLQAMNTLRNTIRGSVSQPNTNAASEGSLELIRLYHRAVNVYGGLCLMKGELKAALDTFCSIYQPATSFTEIVPFQLPMLCLTPGTRNQNGDTVDSTKISPKNLGESIRHLNEMEWRYGPDPCLYFHRANLHRAAGDFDAFVHDLSLVESLDPQFLKNYVKHEYFGDFLDVETISWLPSKLTESIHDALERNEFRIPVVTAATAVVGVGSKVKTKNANQQKQRSFSEIAMLLYLRERVKMNKSKDEFAQVFQLDIFRRLPESKRKAGQLNMLELAQWEGVIFDDVYAEDDNAVVDDQPLQDFVRDAIASSANHPCVYMFAGMIALEKFDVDVASKYFTDAIELVDKKTSQKPQAEASGTSQSSLSQRWFQHVLLRVKYYSLVWRSMTCRVKIEMEKAVEDLNLAAAVRLGDQQTGADDPLLVVQRTLIMLLNGQVKSAYKLLRVLKRSLRLARRNRVSSGFAVTSDATDVIDMFSTAGLNGFHLLPLQVQRESSRMASAHVNGSSEEQDIRQYSSNELSGVERAEEMREEKEEEETAISMVKYALTKKTTPQMEMLDKFYESGILKLSVTGSISQVIPFFQAVLSIDEGYLPPTNFASLEIFKCKEQDFMEEKLFNCFVRLGKRSKWLDKKIKWKFEALIDANLTHAYLPSDMETLWHRARLLQGQHNFVSAINDLTDCLQLMVAHFSWEKGKKGEKAVFANETKRTQWLQLLLERGVLYMELHHWDKAIDDLTMVIAQAGKSNVVLQAGAHEARSNCLIRMKRYGHAIQDLQQLLALSKEPKSSKKGAIEETRRREERMLNCVLVGNLYCQLAVDQMKAGSALARKATATMNPIAMKQAKLAHVNMGFIQRAGEYYDEAESMVADHFLVHYFRGRMYALSGQSQLATKSLTHCLRLHAMFLPALFLRGCIYAQENLFVLALADYYRVRHRIATYPNLHTSIGYCHLERGSLTKAVESFTEALLQRPDDADALYMRGCALQELMILESALKDFNQALVIRPDYYRAHYQYAVCNILLKNYKAATQAMNAVVRLQPEWRDGWILHGYTCFCAERYDVAVSSYGSAISLPDSSEGADRSRQQDSTLFLFRAVCYMQSGKFSAALIDLELAIKRDNENYVAFIAKAYCLSQTGDLARASQTLAHCLPHHKQIKLPPAIDVLESERTKELARNDLLNDSIGTFSAPVGSGTNHKGGSTVIATADKLFHYRKLVRDSEPKQVVRPITSMLGERRASSTNVVGEHSGSVMNASLERRTSSMAPAIVEPKLSSTKSRRFSSLASATHVDAAVELAIRKAKQQLRAKFFRAMKKITFQYRVLKALEDATSSKFKKSQELMRALSDTLQPPSRVAWPKGTLTSRILLWAFNEFGIHHAHDRKVDDALMAFTLAIQSHPRNSDPYFNRGNVYLHINVLHSAVGGYQDAIEEDENCFRARNNMGVAYYKMKRFEEAQDAFATGLHHAEDHKERAILMYNMGATLQALERPDEALDFYQQAISLDSSRTEFFNNRSAILHNQMRYAVALEDYNRALKLQGPESAEDQLVSEEDSDDSGNGVAARLNRAQLYIAMGNCTLASRDLTIVLKTLTQLRDRVPQEQSRDHALPFSSVDTEAKLENLDADIRLATDLLAFSRKWRTAMRIAVKDFLFALHAVPCLTEYEFSPLFGPELVRLQEAEAERMYADESSNDPSDVDRLQIVPLPIQDSSFFNYEREFGHWIIIDDLSDSNDGADLERQEDVRASKREQWTKSYIADVRDALRHSRDGNFPDSSRSLLRAHYKTTLDSHDEYLLLAWRIQVTLQIETEDEGTDFGLMKAITILQEFLEERKTPEEKSQDGGDGNPVSSRRSRLRDNNDCDDDIDQDLLWRSQRRVIRADLYSLLGVLYQLDGRLPEARASFQYALGLRSDHVIAMLNYLQLSVVLAEYEDALDASLHLLDIFVNLAGTKTASQGRRPSELSKVYKGLLNADRSKSVMLPSTTSALANNTIGPLTAQMLSFLKEYRGLVSAQIQANTTHIFKVQGSIANVVQQLRRAARVKVDTDPETTVDESAADPGGLATFNETLQQYHEKILEAPTAFADDPDFEEFYATFHAQFAELCDAVAKTLPLDVGDDEDDDDSSQNGDAKPTGGNDNQDEEQTIEEFLATIDRGRRQSTKRARPLSGDGIVASARRSSSVITTVPTRPNRPNSGPNNALRRRHGA